MTEIQQTNIAVANFIIGELHKDKPFNLKLDAGQTGALYNITSESHHLHSGFVRKLEATLRQRVNNGTGVILEINNNADLYYHVLSSYIAEHDTANRFKPMKIEVTVDQPLNTIEKELKRLGYLWDGGRSHKPTTVLAFANGIYAKYKSPCKNWDDKLTTLSELKKIGLGHNKFGVIDSLGEVS